jgi:hypothetical protein
VPHRRGVSFHAKLTQLRGQPFFLGLPALQLGLGRAQLPRQVLGDGLHVAIWRSCSFSLVFMTASCQRAPALASAFLEEAYPERPVLQ